MIKKFWLLAPFNFVTTHLIVTNKLLSKVKGMCNSNFDNGVCNGAISIAQYPKGEHVDDYGAQIVRVVQILEWNIRIPKTWRQTREKERGTAASARPRKYPLFSLQPKSLYRSRGVGDFYGTGIEIWAGFGPVWQLLRLVFSCFHGQKKKLKTF